MTLRVAVLGSSGMLGTAVVERLSQPFDVVGLAHAALDIADQPAVHRMLMSLRPDVVINAAAFTDVDEAERQTERAFAVNAQAVEMLGAECAGADALLVHFSTDYVFDGEKRSPYVETDQAAPTNVYGASKLAGERALSRTAGRHLILRVGWLYSLHGRNFVTRVLSEVTAGRPIRVVHDQVGTPTSVYAVAQVVEQLLKLIEAGEGDAKAVREVYHVSSGDEVRRDEYARAVASVFSANSGEIVSVSSREFPTPAKRPAYSVLSSQRLRAEWGISLPDWRVQLEQLRDFRHGPKPDLATQANMFDDSALP